MIELGLKGLPPEKISVILNKKEFRTPRGNFWSGVAVYRLLTGETHLGKIISNKTQGDGHKVKRPNAKEYKRLPPDEWVIVENCHEPVKTQEEHDKIMKYLSERQRIPERCRHQSYTFSGLVKCALCGHGLSFMTKDDIPMIRPCWYKDPFGNKCPNSGAPVSTLEKIVLDKITRYKDSFIKEPNTKQENAFDVFQKKWEENQALLEKKKKALEVLNDAYEMGEYSKTQWLERKRKREKEISSILNEITQIKRALDMDPKVVNRERKENLSASFENITEAVSGPDRNDLYKTIVDSIIWHRNGDDISVKIVFK